MVLVQAREGGGYNRKQRHKSMQMYFWCMWKGEEGNEVTYVALAGIRIWLWDIWKGEEGMK